MHIRFTNISSLFICMVLCGSMHAQDTTGKRVRNKFLHNIFKKVVSSVTVSKQDSTAKATVLNSKSERPYTSYEGKIIRRIYIKQFGFERVFTDTSKPIQYYGTRMLNYLHKDTYGWVIRDNLFVRQGMKVNSYMVADNERYLRSLEFIQDARIIALPIRGDRDSIDLEVITKDLFTITGSFEFGGLNRQKFSIAEKNLAGAGQKVELKAINDKLRSPNVGYNFLYTKNSVLHSFINASIGYSNIITDRFGYEAVSSLYMQLSKPLVSAYTKFAGGFQLSFNQSVNTFKLPDSSFYDYQDAYVDLWAGYNIGVNKLLKNNKSLKRTFAAARFLRDDFKRKPFQLGDNFDPYFNNRKALLFEMTFFRQQFYKTNYIYGFGTTEDIPIGYNVALTTGWHKQLNLSRPYFGINANYYSVTPGGSFMQSFVRLGGFSRRGEIQDAGLLTGGSLYSKLYVYKNVKMREYVKFSFSRLYNRVATEPLRIDNAMGLQYFSADSLRGSQRLSAYAETLLFLKYKFFGFQLAPFAFGDASLLSGEKDHRFKSGLYTGIGGGLRTRNENLVFGTIELRFVYFPRKAQDMNSFRVTVRSDIRFRYNSSYVRAPETIQLNTEDANSFY